MTIERVASAPTDREHDRLRRELGRLDTIFFLICAMVAVDTLGITLLFLVQSVAPV